jgi:hypothetical protein
LIKKYVYVYFLCFETRNVNFFSDYEIFFGRGCVDGLIEVSVARILKFFERAFWFDDLFGGGN